MKGIYKMELLAGASCVETLPQGTAKIHVCLSAQQTAKEDTLKRLVDFILLKNVKFSIRAC